LPYGALPTGTHEKPKVTPGSDEPRLNLAELRQLLEAADPAALLVSPRLLRRVIKRDRNLPGLGLQVPHHRSYVIGREALLALASRDELEIGPERPLPATLLLIARPEPERLAALPRGVALVTYWRALFHARIHQTIAGRLTPAAVRERIHRIGQAELEEIRTVLRQEQYLLPPRDDRTTYEEFAAVYLELSTFAASLLPYYFPSIEDFGPIDQLLAEDVDAAALFAATRLAGAPDPVVSVDVPDQAEEPGQEPTGATVLPAPPAEQYRDLVAHADEVAAAGNAVRAAIYRVQAARAAPPELAAAVQAQARAELDRLVERLQVALELSSAEAQAWRQALPALLPRAAHGVWPAEARLLYDLQKICVDHERPVASLDVAEWAYGGFRQPFIRPLPNQPLVLAVKHLRSAVDRLPAARLAEAERHELAVVLHSALHAAEARLRQRFRPVLCDALHQVGLRPESFPEQVGHDKVIEELLDRITERRHLSLGDLRDALARNDLKLHDVSGPGQWLGGDPLLCANRQLAVRAAGVYRRGEIYLRWLHRLSALAFGTRPGRWLTLYLALPFGGAFALLVFAQEMHHLGHWLAQWLAGTLPVKPTPEIATTIVGLGATPGAGLLTAGATLAPVAHEHGHHLPSLWSVGVLGIFLLLVLHVPAFRRLLVAGCKAAWRATRSVLIDLPAAVLRLPAVRRVLDSPVFLRFSRYVLKPLPAAVVAGAALGVYGAEPADAALGGLAVLVMCSLLINSRLGRDLEEIVTDWAVRQWHYFRGLLLPGLLRLVMSFFKGILEAVDRFLYTVDEWLRFRRGEGRLTLAAKTVLGFVWFVVTYVVRLYVNVFIEPAVNPIKHFPAVTVAAKLLVPFWVPLLELLARPVLFLGRTLAYTIAFLNLHALPGAAGFLVWELKENWRLYRSNRPRWLRPVVVGHHGETVLRLLRPGFHSGTLPKLYARLRRAERRAQRSGEWRSARQLRETLRLVEENIRHFAERDLVAFLDGGKGWTAGPVRVATVETGSNSIRIELACPALGKHPLELRLEEHSGWLLAGVRRPGWLPQLADGQAAVLTMALTGFYKKAGVDLVREQIEASLAPACPPYAIAGDRLVVWPGKGYMAEVAYDLGEGPVLHPRVGEGQPDRALPVLPAEQLLFSSREVAWQDWAQAWERDPASAADRKPLLPGMRLLPLQP
jgi:hypothetical protein